MIGPFGPLATDTKTGLLGLYWAMKRNYRLIQTVGWMRNPWTSNPAGSLSSTYHQRGSTMAISRRQKSTRGEDEKSSRGFGSSLKEDFSS